MRFVGPVRAPSPDALHANQFGIATRFVLYILSTFLNLNRVIMIVVKDHQRQHWPKHKDKCKHESALAQIRDSPNKEKAVQVCLSSSPLKYTFKSCGNDENLMIFLHGLGDTEGN